MRVGMREGGLTAKLPVALEGRLSTRLELLRTCVKQAAIADLEEQVAKLMLAYPSTGAHGDVNAMLRVRKYAEDLLGTPLWAVRDACRDVSRGAVPGLNRDFAPSSPRLREIVNGYVSAVHKEAGEIKEVLNAPIVLPDNSEMAEAVRKGVADMIRARANEMREADRAQQSPTGQERPAFRPHSIAECAEIYKTRRLPGLPPRNVSRNDDRNVTEDVDVTIDGDYADLAQQAGA